MANDLSHSFRFLQPCERNVNRNYYYGFASPDEHKAYDGSLRFDDCNFFDARKTTPPPPSKSTLQSYYKVRRDCESLCRSSHAE